jgi:hypothetical protein
VFVGLVLFIQPVAQARQPHVRPSTIDEINFTKGMSPEISTYWEARGYLWAPPEILPPQPGLLSVQEPLTIVLDFDYGRTLNFGVDLRREGNRFMIDAAAIAPSITTADIRIPEDSEKEYLHPIGRLEPGDYTIIARTFSIHPKLGVGLEQFGKFDEIDFSTFRRDPLAYVLPEGLLLDVKESQTLFTVVPEPSFSVLALCACITGIWWRRIGRQPI